MDRLLRLLPVALGGALGTMLRFYLEESLGTNLKFPIGILVANLAGCLLIGAINALLPRANLRSGALLRLLLATGFCGGLTTLSTLAVSLAEQLIAFNPLQALLYGSATIVAGVLAAYLGRTLVLVRFERT